jgi:hypothetical protein
VSKPSGLQLVWCSLDLSFAFSLVGSPVPAYVGLLRISLLILPYLDHRFGHWFVRIDPDWIAPAHASGLFLLKMIAHA